MLELCLFDLDNTLVGTDDLKEIREACKENEDRARLTELRRRLGADPGRRIYSQDFLESIRAEFPDLKLGIFTRAPRSYTEVVLEWAYPGFEWDVVVAYEDVTETKPHGEGVDVAMQQVGVEYIDLVALIGDTDVDVKAAYNAGCLAAVDKQDWPMPHLKEHWRALDFLPDAVIEKPQDVLDFISDHLPFLPNLERLLEAGELARGWRYVKVGYFIPREIEVVNRPAQIWMAGRSFSNYQSVKWRRMDHSLSDSIENSKEADDLPREWIEAIRNFIDVTFDTLFQPREVVVTAVPHRPGRKPRLERLLDQLAESLDDDPLDATVTCVPNLLAYTEGVRSNHNEHLSAVERFANVRDHLVVNRPRLVSANKVYLILDDVVTTGASLIYAQKRLVEAGASKVELLGLGKNIGELFRRA